MLNSSDLSKGFPLASKKTHPSPARKSSQHANPMQLCLSLSQLITWCTGGLTPEVIRSARRQPGQRSLSRSLKGAGWSISEANAGTPLSNYSAGLFDSSPAGGNFDRYRASPQVQDGDRGDGQQLPQSSYQRRSEGTKPFKGSVWASQNRPRAVRSGSNSSSNTPSSGFRPQARSASQPALAMLSHSYGAAARSAASQASLAPQLQPGRRVPSSPAAPFGYGRGYESVQGEQENSDDSGGENEQAAGNRRWQPVSRGHGASPQMKRQSPPRPHQVLHCYFWDGAKHQMHFVLHPRSIMQC